MKFFCLTIFTIVIISFSIPSSASIKQDTTKQSIIVSISPRKSSCIFNGSKIGYKIHIENRYKEPQDGKVVYEIITDKNKKLFGGIFNVHIAPKSTLNLKVKFKVHEPGFFDIVTRINITDYDDTIKKVFAFKPQLINPPLHKPEDFEKFWIETRKELEAIDPLYVIQYNQKRSTLTHKVYEVDMQSLENITIHAILTIPRLPGKFPVLLLLPGYNQHFEPFMGDNEAGLCLSVRTPSQLTKKNKNPTNETENCLVNIDDKNNYFYRGVYMDCVRAVDFIFTNFKMGLDTSRVIVMGGSQGGALALVTCALDHRVSICGADIPFYCNFPDYYDIASKKTPENFPINLFVHHFRSMSPPKYYFLKTMAYFDVMNFASYIRCPCIIGLGMMDPIAPPTCVYSVYNKLSPRIKRMSEIHVLPNIAHTITEEYSYIKLMWVEENIVFSKH